MAVRVVVDGATGAPVDGESRHCNVCKVQEGDSSLSLSLSLSLTLSVSVSVSVSLSLSLSLSLCMFVLCVCVCVCRVRLFPWQQTRTQKRESCPSGRVCVCGSASVRPCVCITNHRGTLPQKMQCQKHGQDNNIESVLCTQLQLHAHTPPTRTHTHTPAYTQLKLATQTRTHAHC